jgi:hypothetical protein
MPTGVALRRFLGGLAITLGVACTEEKLVLEDMGNGMGGKRWGVALQLGMQQLKSLLKFT